MTVPCRKCPRCLQFRQLRWRQRAIQEIAQANRTWFVTLTFSPVQLAGVLVSAAKPDLVQVERRAYRDVQHYMKRLRKTGAAFRYLAVYERGEASGRSHYHLLVHETGRWPIPKRVLEDTWPSHVHARLVDDVTTGAATYVTKYLTKAIEIRPRASVKYGRNALKENVTHTIPNETNEKGMNLRE